MRLRKSHLTFGQIADEWARDVSFAQATRYYSIIPEKFSSLGNILKSLV